MSIKLNHTIILAHDSQPSANFLAEILGLPTPVQFGPFIVDKKNIEMKRCAWVGINKPHYEHYHDTEWGIPVHEDLKHFEMILLEGAQAGLNWETILKRREGYRDAFKQFNPLAVANMTDEELEKLLTNPNIIRNRLKIFSARQNARVFIKIQKEFGSFDHYVWQFVGGKQIVNRPETLKDIPVSTKESTALSRDLKKRGMRFVGETIMYAYMQAVGLVDDHVVDCFRCSSSNIMNNMPLRVNKQSRFLKAQWIDTVLGPMIAIADETALYLLEFATRKGLEGEVKRLQKQGYIITPGSTGVLISIEKELNAYFAGTLITFKTPYHLVGSTFQQNVWKALCKIPYGETISYAQLSAQLGKPTAYRAVANANGANQLALIIPCHRVIASNGSIGGYGGGLVTKQRLIDHEKQHDPDYRLTKDNLPK